MVFEVLSQMIPQLIFLLRNSCFLIRYEYAKILLLLYSAELVDPSVRLKVFRMCMDEIRCRNLMFHCEPFYPLSCQKFTALATLCNAPETSSSMIELLNHPLEEVRLEALQQLDLMDSATVIWAPLLPTLETIATDENESPECRIKALKLFSHLSATVEKLKWLLAVYNEATDDSIRCSALAAFGKTTHSTSPDNLHLLVEWSRYLLEATQSSVQFRQIVVESIAAFPLMFQMDEMPIVTQERGSLLVNMWMCLLNCLMDDEDSIRTAASAIIGNECCNMSLQPAVAIEKALEFLVDRIGTFYPTEVVSMLSQSVLDEDEQPEDGDSPSFEKCGSDAFREPLAHSLLFCKFIERCAKKNDVSSFDSDVLSEYLEVRWKMLENCDISTLHSPVSGRRFARIHIIDLVKIYLVTKSLYSVNDKIATLHQCIRKRFLQVNSQCFTYLIQYCSQLSPVSPSFLAT